MIEDQTLIGVALGFVVGFALGKRTMFWKLKNNMFAWLAINSDRLNTQYGLAMLDCKDYLFNEGRYK